MLRQPTTDISPPLSPSLPVEPTASVDRPASTDVISREI
jgi:hypothetical protein